MCVFRTFSFIASSLPGTFQELHPPDQIQSDKLPLQETVLLLLVLAEEVVVV